MKYFYTLGLALFCVTNLGASQFFNLQWLLQNGYVHNSFACDINSIDSTEKKSEAINDFNALNSDQRGALYTLITQLSLWSPFDLEPYERLTIEGRIATEREFALEKQSLSVDEYQALKNRFEQETNTLLAIYNTLREALDRPLANSFYDIDLCWTLGIGDVFMESEHWTTEVTSKQPYTTMYLAAKRIWEAIEIAREKEIARRDLAITLSEIDQVNAIALARFNTTESIQMNNPPNNLLF